MDGERGTPEGTSSDVEGTPSDSTDSASDIGGGSSLESSVGDASTPTAEGEPTSTVGPTPTPREEAALDRVRKVSRLLDEAIRVPGTDFRIGLDPILGILPGAGDAVSAAVSMYPVFEAYRLGVPKRMLAKMLALVAVDAAAGSVPVIGPVFDAFWKANEWNLRTLEDYLDRA